LTKVINIALILLFLGGLFYLYSFYNPSEHSFFVPCPFKYATGYHCPGCGSQRAIHQLLHLNIGAAFRLNPLLILSLPLLFMGLGIKVWNYIFETKHRVKLFYSNLFIYTFFIITILFWVLRNIPFYPFNLLAPTE